MTDGGKLRQHMNITTTVELRITPPHYCDSALQVTWRGKAYQKTACSNLVFDKITAKEVVRSISSGASKVGIPLKQVTAQERAPNGFGSLWPQIELHEKLLVILIVV